MKFRKTRQHPCWNWCGERIKGIVENAKLTGETSEDFQVEIKSLIGFSFIPPYTYVLTCQHGRDFSVREKPKAR